MDELISVDEALSLVLKNTDVLKSERKRIEDALLCVLADDVKSPSDSPPFPQSSMDGYAIRFDDLKRNNSLLIQGINQAGTDTGLELQKGAAIRIYTGAMVPPGADTIVIQENVLAKDGAITILDMDAVKKNAFVREQGKQLKKNKVALSKGHVLNAGSIGYLTSIGIDRVKTISLPRISIITVGNELQMPGKNLKPAQIYESNSYALQSLLREMRLRADDISRVEDDPEKLNSVFKKAIRQNDVVIVTGGVSVGDYDFVANTLNLLQVNKVFHGVAQKPGKPMYFGTFKGKLIFALPGNPASVMVCFYQYVYPALRKMTGHKDLGLLTALLECTTDYQKKPGLTHFLKSKTTGNQVDILEGQESFMLSSFALANCLVQLPASSSGVKAKDKVVVQYISPL